ncbi:MAG: glycosyltransferase [Puniceicoccales bacterium]|jgi:glycosyltransferase involved in cell wall biosynthesis|nr:glycosyltransferase [Puniceicoccales bacterium]
MEMQPPVTVFIPFHEDAPFLERAIGSVRAQTLENIEILCIDDGSTDGSVAIAEEFARGDGRIRILHNESNLGINRTRCRGIREARGEFIFSLDGDDALEPNIASIALGYARKLRVDIVEFQERIHTNGMNMHWRLQDKTANGKVRREPLKYLLHQHILCGHLHHRMVRREVYLAALDLLGDAFCNASISLYEDLAHTVAICKVADCWTKINQIGYHYFTRRGSISKPDDTTISAEKLRQLIAGQIVVIHRILEILHHRQRPILLRFAALHLFPALEWLQKLLSPGDYADFLAPFLGQNKFGKIFSLEKFLPAKLLATPPEEVIFT